MSEDLPYLALWPKDYLTNTRHLTTEQHGAYLLLLMEAWLRPSCSLPNDENFLAKIAGMSPRQWEKNRDTLMAFWKFDGRRKEWTQKRLQKERKKAAIKKQKASDSAASRWKTKKKNNANAKRTQCSPEPYPEEKPNGFSDALARGKKTGSGFVKPRNAADAAMAFIERRGLNHDHDSRSAGRDSKSFGDDVSRLPSIGSSRR